MYTNKQHIVLKLFYSRPFRFVCRSPLPFMQATNGASAGLPALTILQECRYKKNKPLKSAHSDNSSHTS